MQMPGFGIYHTGLEVGGVEYSFAGAVTQSSGVQAHRPKIDPEGGQWTYDHQILLGRTKLSKQEVCDSASP